MGEPHHPAPLRPWGRGEYKSKFNRMAYQKGYEAAAAGQPADANPNAAWHAGWKQYWQERESRTESAENSRAVVEHSPEQARA